MSITFSIRQSAIFSLKIIQIRIIRHVHVNKLDVGNIHKLYSVMLKSHLDPEINLVRFLFHIKVYVYINTNMYTHRCFNTSHAVKYEVKLVTSYCKTFQNRSNCISIKRKRGEDKRWKIMLDFDSVIFNPSSLQCTNTLKNNSQKDNSRILIYWVSNLFYHYFLCTHDATIVFIFSYLHLIMFCHIFFQYQEYS